MLVKASEKTIQQAADLLRNGELVAFPTETVYGLGASAELPAAIHKVFLAKNRPADHPLIVHLQDLQQLSLWADPIPELAWRLARHFWPGPLTLILPKAAKVSKLITAGQSTIGIRIPSHPIAQALLKAVGTGVVAPSANLFGHVSPTHAEHVLQDLDEQVAMILDGGPSPIGIESTIIDVTSETAKILRPGKITIDQIRAITPCELTHKSEMKVSGNLASHYAPHIPLKIVDIDDQSAFEKIMPQTAQQKVMVLSFQAEKCSRPNIDWKIMPQDPDQYAHDLYATLRAIEQEPYNWILVEQVPNTEVWRGIADRLCKASIK